MPATTVQAVCHMLEIKTPHHRHHKAIDLMGSSNYAVPRAYCNKSLLSSQELPKINLADISHSQQKDPCIGEVWLDLMQNSVNHANKGKHPDVSLLL